MQTTLEQLAKELIDCRGKLQEFELRQKADHEPYEQAKLVIQEKLLEKMTKQNTLSTCYKDFTISQKKASRPVVTNEFAAIATLKETRPEYIVESIASQALKEVERGSLTLDGVTMETKEHVSIRQADRINYHTHMSMKETLKKAETKVGLGGSDYLKVKEGR